MSHLGVVETYPESLRKRAKNQPTQGSGQPPNDQPPNRQPPNGQPPGRQPPADDSGISRRAVAAGVGVVAAAGAGWFILNDDDDSSSPSGDEQEIRNVLRTQAQALENDDIEAYMETMHPESPLYDSTRSTTSQLMQRYDFRIELTVDSVEVNGDTATADTTQETRIEGSDPNFQANRSELVHELRTYQGEWRVYDSSISDRTYL